MKRKKGFSLLELSIVIAIGSMVMAGMLKLLIALANKQSIMINQSKVKEVQMAIEAFMVKNNRIPCPANPSLAYTDANYGLEGLATDGTGDCSFTVKTTSTANPIDAGFINQVIGTSGTTSKLNHKIVFGALPFRSLGLPESSMYDGFGNKFSYIVPAGYAANRSASSSKIYSLIKGWARVALPARFFNTIQSCSSSATPTSTTNDKYCMETISASLITATVAKPLIITTLVGEGWYRDTSTLINKPGDVIITPCRFSIKNPQNQYISAENLAYVIISHGQNGYGAWNKNGTLNPQPTNTYELQNTFLEYTQKFPDRILYTPTSREIAIISDQVNKQNGFDDEVYYVTIDNLLNNTGKNDNIYCHQSTSFLDQLVPRETSTYTTTGMSLTNLPTANSGTPSCYIWNMANSTQKNIPNASQTFNFCDSYDGGLFSGNKEYFINMSCQSGGIWSDIGVKYKQ